MTKFTIQIETEDPESISYIAILAELLINGDQASVLSQDVQRAFGWLLEQVLNYRINGDSWDEKDEEDFQEFIDQITVWLGRFQEDVVIRKGYR